MANLRIEIKAILQVSRSYGTCTGLEMSPEAWARVCGIAQSGQVVGNTLCDIPVTVVGDLCGRMVVLVGATRHEVPWHHHDLRYW